MANANSTASINSTESLKVSENNWSRVYRGSKPDLVATGLIKSEWFPGMPGIPKETSRIGLIDGEMKPLPFRKAATRGQEEAGMIRIRQENKTTFKVFICFSADEKDRREAKEKIEKFHAEKQKELKRAPKSIDQFRISKNESIDWFLRGTFDMFRRASNGYHYSREVTKEASDLISDLIELAKEGQVYFDQQRQDYFLEDVEKKAADRTKKEFPEFSAFMASALAIGKAALND